MNLYPNEEAWRVLDLDDSQRQAWNRYNHAVWVAGPPGSKPQITGSWDTVIVNMDRCDPRLAQLSVRTLVSVTPEAGECLVDTDRLVDEWA